MRALRLLPLLAGALALALAAPRPAAAQANSCLLQYQNGPWQIVGAPESRVIAADGPLLVTCNGGEELRADSAVIYQLSNEVHLFGNVDFQDPTRSLTADRATYTSTTGRLYATGNVVFTDKQRGSTLRGPELEYFRAMEGRPQSQAIATQRPHLTVVPKNDGGGERREPMEVDADRITTVGDKYMTAEGTVVIQGKDLDASAAEAYYDSDTERMELRRQARVKGEKYELTGEFIESDLAEGRLEKVLARTNARLVSERMTMTGPQLQLFFADDLLQRLVSGRAQVAGQDSAAATGRSVALAKGFRMEADSLEVLMPGQRLKEVHAIGRAQGEAWDTAAVRTVGTDTAGAPAALAPAAGGDTVPPTALGERDQLMADTIIGYFRPDTAAADSLARDSAAADTARRPAPAQRDTAGPEDQDAELERMVAIGNARSLYRLKDDDEPDRKPGINYVTGEKIDLTFADGEVDVAKVTGLQRGVYLDPDAPQQAQQPPAGEGAQPPAGQPAGRPGQPNQPTGTPQRQTARPQPPAPTPGGRP